MKNVQPEIKQLNINLIMVMNINIFAQVNACQLMGNIQLNMIYVLMTVKMMIWLQQAFKKRSL